MDSQGTAVLYIPPSASPTFTGPTPPTTFQVRNGETYSIQPVLVIPDGVIYDASLPEISYQVWDETQNTVVHVHEPEHAFSVERKYWVNIEADVYRYTHTDTAGEFHVPATPWASAAEGAYGRFEITDSGGVEVFHPRHVDRHQRVRHGRNHRPSGRIFGDANVYGHGRPLPAPRKKRRRCALRAPLVVARDGRRAAAAARAGIGDECGIRNSVLGRRSAHRTRLRRARDPVADAHLARTRTRDEVGALSNADVPVVLGAAAYAAVDVTATVLDDDPDQPLFEVDIGPAGVEHGGPADAHAAPARHRRRGDPHRAPRAEPPRGRARAVAEPPLAWELPVRVDFPHAASLTPTRVPRCSAPPGVADVAALADIAALRAGHDGARRDGAARDRAPGEGESNAADYCASRSRRTARGTPRRRLRASLASKDGDGAVRAVEVRARDGALAVTPDDAPAPRAARALAPARAMARRSRSRRRRRPARPRPRACRARACGSTTPAAAACRPRPPARRSARSSPRFGGELVPGDERGHLVVRDADSRRRALCGGANGDEAGATSRPSLRAPRGTPADAADGAACARRPHIAALAAGEVTTASTVTSRCRSARRGASPFGAVAAAAAAEDMQAALDAFNGLGACSSPAAHVVVDARQLDALRAGGAGAAR